MKQIKFAVMLLAATALFSCSKESVDNSVEPINGETNVTVKLDVSSHNSSTRASDIPQTNGSTTTLHDGTCYFFNSSKELVKQLPINATEIKAGQKFTGVPSAATQLYIVANRTKSGGTYTIEALGTTLDAIKASISQTVTSQNLAGDTDKATSDNVVMEGLSAAFQGTAPEMTAAVTITPIMSRLEIDKISFTGVTDVTLEGIFINNIFTEVNMLLVNDPTKIVKKTNAADFPGTGAGIFTEGMYDHNTAGIGGTTFVKTPGAGKVWAYQFVPTTTAGGDNLPHIVIKLKDVKADGQLAAPTTFVTVMSYKDKDNKAVTEFKKSNVYKIDNIAISYTNIGPDPEDKNINVTATVTITPWTVNAIQPEL